jgi:hypothetical protein
VGRKNKHERSVHSLLYRPPLVTEDLPGGEDVWKVVNGYAFVDDQGIFSWVEAGTITDFASIPAFLWPSCGHPRDPDIAAGAAVHDEDYRLGRGTRAASDKRLALAMTVLGASWWKRQKIYWGLRAFGWKAWNEYRRKRVQKTILTG